MSALIVILGDQLSRDIASLQGINPDCDTVLMCEVRDEATYVKHHKKKIAFLFSAMRHFAEALQAEGIAVRYIRYDDPDNAGSFRGEVERAITDLKPERILVTHPGEYRVLKDIKGWQKAFDLPVSICEDDRFLCSIGAFKQWAGEKKQLRMEYFYREMRRRYHILMDGDQPEGGQWNYDSENRKPPREGLDVPAHYRPNVDDITQEVVELVEREFDDHFGDLEPFHFAVTRDQALYALRKFIEERLGRFGDYQDAMVEGEPWMFHSHLSFYLNCGLLNPLECVQAAEKAYRDGQAPLNAVEGFIRQIMGWREFVRGIYWREMPGYAKQNFFNATRPVPEFFWTGQTDMNCLKQCISETRANAYAHHIQRLMVLGNFALLAGLDVAEVNEWYLIVYADAYEWVEMPNVTGMILYADGGLLASKPYAAGGNYINKMSDYCKNCQYSPSKKQGEGACPFNYLYWDFMIRNRDKLKDNQRVGMMYGTLDRMGDDKIKAIQSDSKTFLEALT